MTGSHDSSPGPAPGCDEKAEVLKAQKPMAAQVRENSFFSPWANWHGWVVLLAGVVLGQSIGFSPQLFIVIALLCLICGWLFDR